MKCINLRIFMGSLPLLFILFVGNIVVLGFNIYWYVMLMRKDRVISAESSKLQEKGDQVLAKAEGESKQILESAHQKAAEMLGDIDLYRKTFEARWAELLSDVKAKHSEKIDVSLRMFAANVEGLMVDSEKHVADVLEEKLNQIVVEGKSAIGSYVELMKTHTEELQTSIESKLRDSLQNVDTDVEKYRKAQMEKVNVEITHIIEQVAGDVMSKSLSTDEHEQLIMNALEEASKQGLLKLKV